MIMKIVLKKKNNVIFKVKILITNITLNHKKKQIKMMKLKNRRTILKMIIFD